jgi:hypothetical protein
MILMFLGLEDGESQDVKRSLWMPAVEGTINADEKNALYDIVAGLAITVKSWNVSLHEFVSWGLA